MDVTSTQTTIENLTDIPELLYKYRSWKDKFHKEILTDQIVFMSAPTSFEDSMDCKLQKRYDLITEEEIYNKYLMDSKRNNPNWSRQQHRKFARDWSKKSPIRDKKGIQEKQKTHFNEFDKRFGVLSLTSNQTRLEMWEKYADSHSGFCVGFDSRKMFKYLGGGGMVNYYEELPNILPSDSFEVEHFKQIYSKESKWSFEQEYRTHKFYPSGASISDRRTKLPKECYKEIIFGSNLSLEQRKEIIEICKSQGLNVSFFEEKISEDDQISIKILEYDC